MCNHDQQANKHTELQTQRAQGARVTALSNRCSNINVETPLSSTVLVTCANQIVIIVKIMILITKIVIMIVIVIII